MATYPKSSATMTRMFGRIAADDTDTTFNVNGSKPTIFEKNDNSLCVPSLVTNYEYQVLKRDDLR